MSQRLTDLPVGQLELEKIPEEDEIILNSFHLEFFGGPKTQGTPFWAMNAVYKWFFAVGFAGIGLSISIDDMKKAGGAAFLIGSGAATAKMILGLIAVLLVGAALLQVTGGN